MDKKQRLLDTLVTLDNIFGVSGEEYRVGEQLSKELKGCYDELIVDPIGNYIFHKKGNGKKVLLSCHMDEIGFMVRFIDDAGLLHIVPVGYHDDRMVINQDMVIYTKEGTVEGVTGGKPAHLTGGDENKVTSMDDITVDIGALPRKEAEDLGVRIGDYLHYNRIGKFLNSTKIYSGKSVDNRSGCAVCCEAFRRLVEENTNIDLYLAGTVQEELGARGAGVVGNRIQPDMAIVVDVTIVGGVNGIELSQVPVETGKGPAIKYYDWDPNDGMGINVPKHIVRMMEKTAEVNNIPYQREVLMHGGTDGYTLAKSGNGVATGVISIPQRYMHTAVGTVHTDDLENSVCLLVKCIEDNFESDSNYSHT